LNSFLALLGILKEIADNSNVKKSLILTLVVTLFLQQNVVSISAAQAENDLNRIAIDPSIRQKSPLVKCVSAQQLDCIEKVMVEHEDTSIEEAAFVKTRLVNFPDENGQKVQYGDILFDFHSGKKKSGLIKRLRLSTHVISPEGFFNGKKAGAYWIMLQRELLPTEPPQQSKAGICSQSTPLECASYPALDTEDVFHVYLRTSWLSPVSASGSGKNFNIDYRKIKGGFQWKLTGSEYLQPMFSDTSRLAESIKPGNENMIPDRLNPTLYFALDHGGKDLSDSYWDPRCMDKGFTRTMWNAPLAGQLFWDYGTQSLNFNMYAPHSDPFGKEYLGAFRTKFQKAWLDCRFPDNNLSTSTKLEVQVLDLNGVPQVSTSVVSMKNGIIDISVTGFHFSSPRIVAKRALNSGSTAKFSSNFGDDWSEILVAPTVKRKSTSTKKVTITCVNGKINRKVTAAKPVCPAGYKKK
jgi:hypothetical protein